MPTVRAGVRVDTAGLRELKNGTQQRNATLKAVKAGGKVVQADAKARAPRRAGRGGGGLKQSMGVKGVKGTKGKTLAYAVIGPRKKVVRQVPTGKSGRTRKHVPAFVAHIVEGGAKPHRLNGGMHPGARKQPFIRPGYEATKGRAADATEKVLATEVGRLIEKAAAKTRAKAGGK